MFINEDIPSNFNKIAEIKDNYIILVKEDVLENDRDYEAYIQYLSPSTSYIYLEDYRINDGDTYNYDVNYVNNNYFNIIDSVDCSFTKHTYTIDNITNDFWDRPDYWSIGLSVALLLSLTILIVNLATSLVYKGGIFK